MEDERILALFFDRKEQAISETEKKYGNYLSAIAVRIVHDQSEVGEILNDTYAAAWNAIPPARPEKLSLYLGKITRALSLNRIRDRKAEKRGGGETVLCFEELEDVLSGENDPASKLEEKELSLILDDFLSSLPEAERRVFVCRYWYFDPVSEIASRFDYSESKVKMMLLRTREKLKKRLEKENYPI